MLALLVGGRCRPQCPRGAALYPHTKKAISGSRGGTACAPTVLVEVAQAGDGLDHVGALVHHNHSGGAQARLQPGARSAGRAGGRMLEGERVGGGWAGVGEGRREGSGGTAQGPRGSLRGRGRQGRRGGWARARALLSPAATTSACQNGSPRARRWRERRAGPTLHVPCMYTARAQKPPGSPTEKLRRPARNLSESTGDLQGIRGPASP